MLEEAPLESETKNIRTFPLLQLKNFKESVIYDFPLFDYIYFYLLNGSLRVAVANLIISEVISMRSSESESLNILLVSDIHLQYPYLEKLKKWYTEVNKESVLRFDYVFVPGDTGVVKYDEPEATAPGTQAGAEGTLAAT